LEKHEKRAFPEYQSYLAENIWLFEFFMRIGRIHLCKVLHDHMGRRMKFLSRFAPFKR
jgi:hypothetical protein